ncbi:MAG TPA: PIN domain-containing protein [Microbacterium sp.]|nr:PIN domain-containing protein [Microbacterium sp.]
MTLACDTSILIPLVAPWHPDRDTVLTHTAAISSVPAHALLECFSVLTRLPPPHRAPPAAAAAVLAALSMAPIALAAHQQRELIIDCAAIGISGGAVYDALIGATAAAHGLMLLTRDARARRTYDALGIEYRTV